jgi:hypothetical protein
VRYQAALRPDVINFTVRLLIRRTRIIAKYRGVRKQTQGARHQLKMLSAKDI